MKNKSVLISLSGGIKSLVAAYILKKQGDNLVGAFVQIPSLDGDSYSLKSSCHQSDEELVKKYCELLEIPYIKIDGSEYYKHYVVDRVIAAKLAGETFIPCVYCNQVRMDLLIQKADELDIELVATGHLAQKAQSVISNSFYIIQAQDTPNDQSYFLTNLENSVIERLRFPLGKLALSEIHKIGKTLLGKKIEGTAHKICLMDEDFLPQFIEEHTPDSLRPKGNIFEYFNDLPLGEHDGIYKYKLGQTNIRATFSDVDPSFEIVKMDPNKKEIKVAKNWKYEISFLLLKKLNPYRELDLTKPLRCELSFNPFEKKKLPGILYFGNNEKGHFELEKPIHELIEIGLHLVFYQGSKVIGSAQVEKTQKKGPSLTDTFQL